MFNIWYLKYKCKISLPIFQYNSTKINYLKISHHFVFDNFKDDDDHWNIFKTEKLWNIKIINTLI